VRRRDEIATAAIQVLAHLSSWGARLSFHDPFVTGIDEHGVKLRRRRLTEELVRDSDAVIVLTPHATYDLREIARWSSLLFDARNATGRRDDPDIEVL